MRSTRLTLFRRPLHGIATVASIAFLAACDGASEPDVPTPVAIVVAPTQVTLDGPGSTRQLIGNVIDGTGTTINIPVTWTSTNSQVATVTSSGLVTAVAYGSAQIRASSQNLQASVSITVSPSVQSVTVTHNPVPFEVGQFVPLTVTVRLSNGALAQNPVVTFTSGNPAIAVVDANGRVTGMQVGSTTITATSGGRSGSVAILVTALSGSYRLTHVGSSTLPYNLSNESCVVPPLTVCTVREFVTEGTLTLNNLGIVTFTELHRTDIRTATTNSSVVTTESWLGTWTATQTLVSMTLFRQAAGPYESFLGALSGNTITMTVRHSNQNFSYRFTR